MPDRPGTIHTAVNLAINYRDSGRMDDAVRVLDEWLPRGRKKLAPNEFPMTFALAVAMSIYDSAGTPAKAEAIHQDVADYWKQKAGAESPQYATRLAFLGVHQ